ncbi:MAG: hypothetical protein P8Z70_11480, partial [Desulfuromonadales bacterium]
MKLRMSKWKIASGLLFSLLALAACGGGGGGSNDGGGVPSAYTGVTTQATLTSDNAQDIVVGAWTGGMTGSDLGSVVTLQANEPPSAPSLPGQLRLAETLKAPVLQVTSGTALGVKPAYSDSNTIYGDTGYATYSVNVNESTGAFSGSFTFNNYSSQGTVISGSMSFSGKLDLSTGNMSQFTLACSSLTVGEGTLSATVVGKIRYTISADATRETETIDLVMIDNNTQKSFWMHNFALVITHGSDSDQVTISGSYYDPDHGFVEIRTSSP